MNSIRNRQSIGQYGHILSYNPDNEIVLYYVKENYVWTGTRNRREDTLEEVKCMSAGVIHPATELTGPSRPDAK